MPDIIVALYSEGADAERARTELVRGGFATDRIDVASKATPGPALHAATSTGAPLFRAFFRTLLQKSPLSGDADGLADRIEQGSTALIVHPRGRVELQEANVVLDRHHALLVRRDVRESVAPTPVVGEHAAGRS